MSASTTTGSFVPNAGALDPVTITAKRIKAPAPSIIIPNPMHRFASWSYTWTLWWLDLNDYNQLMSSPRIEDANNWEPTVGLSYVIAEDAGLYPDRRLPGVPYNYNIEDVEFETLITPNNKTKNSNLISGSMTIREPLGITLIDVLVKAGYILNPSEPQNYIQRPYMLECNFVGYDDNGDPVPRTETAIYRKRFPIRLLTMDIALGTGGAEYKLTYCAAGHIAHFDELGKIPKDINISAGTVDEFFNGPAGLAAQLNNYWIGLQVQGPNGPGAAKVQYPDSYAFKIDSKIASSNIVDQKRLTLKDVKADGINMDFTKQIFKISRGTAIIDIIAGIMSHSDYFIVDQGVGSPTTGSSSSDNQTTIFNIFKTQVKTQYTDKVGQATQSGSQAVFDTFRNCYPQAVTYTIHQYPTWDGKDPNMPLLMDSRPYTFKSYEYYYTGHNADVIEMGLQFNTTFYTAIMAYNDLDASSVASASTGDTYKARQVPVPPIGIGTIGGMIPAVAAAAQFNPTPLRYRVINNDPNWASGYNRQNRKEAILASQVQNSTYTQAAGDMVALEMKIVGDPTLIKQDDWYYGPDPTASGDYNAWQSLSQSDFVTKYGHPRTDTGELVVSVMINSVYDLDADVSGLNQGLMFPNPGTGVVPSVFSGQYKIETVKNEFSGGKFEQTLKLYRYINDSIIGEFARAQLAQRYTATSTAQVPQPPSAGPATVGGAVGQAQTNATAVNATADQRQP